MTYEKMHRLASRFKQLAARETSSGNVSELDAVIAITGPRGAGKSTCAIQFARFILGNKFSLKENVAWTKEDVEKMLNEKMNSVIIINEAILSAYKQDWARKFNRELNKRVTQMRVNHNVVIFCIPRLWDLTELLRNETISFWIDCMIHTEITPISQKDVDVKVNRGTAAFMEKVYTPRQADSWDTRRLENAFKVIDKKGYDHDRYLNCYFGYRPFFKGFFKFPDLPIDIKEKFKKMDFEFKMRPISDDDEHPRGYELKFKKLEKTVVDNLTLEGFYQKKIGEIMGLSQQRVSQIQKEPTNFLEYTTTNKKLPPYTNTINTIPEEDNFDKTP